MSVAQRLAADPEVRLTGHLFERAFGTSPAGVWRAPGGLVLLGGPAAALAVALPWGVIIAAAPLPSPVVEFYSMNHHSEGFSVGLDELETSVLPEWSRAAARALVEAGRPGGLRLVINRELPLETGLLSGAETICAVGLAVADLFGVAVPESVDPAYAAARHGRDCGALLVSSGRVDQLPFDLGAAGLRLLVVDPGVVEGLPGHPSRVGEAVILLQSGKAALLGPLLTAAHVRGVPALDLVLDATIDAGGLGGRAIGQCVVALVPMAAVGAIRAAVTARLAGMTRRPPRFLTATPAPGAVRAG